MTKKRMIFSVLSFAVILLTACSFFRGSGLPTVGPAPAPSALADCVAKVDYVDEHLNWGEGDLYCGTLDNNAAIGQINAKCENALEKPCMERKGEITPDFCKLNIRSTSKGCYISGEVTVKCT